MNKYSHEDLRNMYDHVPKDDAAFKAIREMFTLHLEENVISEKELTSHKHFQDFALYYSKYLQHVLDEKDPDEIARLHNEHHLTNTFKALKKKENRTGKTEYCPIKLEIVSGMTEYHSRLDILSVHGFLDDLCKDIWGIDVKMLMQSIVNHLNEYDLYDHHNSYRVGLSLSSDSELTVIIQYNPKQSKEGALYFTITDNIQIILDILEKQGYLATEHNTIEHAIGPITETESDDEDDDDSEHA